jgi:hypothetical protein
MYDRHSLEILMKRCWFCEVKLLSASQSGIPDFGQDFLDVNPDGSAYKGCSLYCEARKP